MNSSRAKVWSLGKSGGTKLKQNKKTTVVRLAGGLGNQLFMYSVGVYLESRLSHKVVFDVSSIEPFRDKRKNPHGVSILNLDLPLKHISYSAKSSVLGSYLRHYLAGVQSRLFMKPEKLMLFPSFSPTELGYVGDLSDIRKGALVRGYFQAAPYTEKFVSDVSDATTLLPNPGGRFLTLSQEMRVAKPIVLHVRRGDYSLSGQKWGLLSSHYYRKALALAFDLVGKRQVWIFSDDIPKAQNLLAPIGLTNCVWVESSSKSTAEEDMILTSLGIGSIIANSSFSWWGARLNKSAKFVIAPKPWFRDLRSPEKLYPDSWILVDSDWED